MLTRVKFLIFLAPLVFVFSGCTAPVTHLPTPTGAAQASGRLLAAPNTTPQPALLEKRQLILEWPATIREQDSDLIVLTIAVEKQGQLTATAQTSGASGASGAPGAPGAPAVTPTGIPVEIPDIYATHNIVAVARLDLAGMEAYREDIREPLRPGQPVTFRWSIRAASPGSYRGVVWLRLELVPKSGGQIEEMLLLARPIEIQTVTVLGMPGSLARIVGGAGLVLSTVLGYPFIQSWLAGWLKKRRGPKGQPARSNPETEEVHQQDE